MTTTAEPGVQSTDPPRPHAGLGAFAAIVVLSLAAEDIDLEADPDKPPAEGGNA